MSLLAQQVAGLMQTYRPPVPSGGRVNVCQDDSSDVMEVEDDKPSNPRPVASIRRSILRYVAKCDTPPTIKDIAAGIHIKWDRVRKQVYQLVSQGRLQQLGDHRKHTYIINQNWTNK